MSDKKQLKDELLEKVSGGIEFIVKVVVCPHCGEEIHTPGMQKEGATDETRLCPHCGGEYDGNLHY